MKSPVWAYVCLLVWIPAWLILGSSISSITAISLAGISLAPLFFALPGVLKGVARAEIWGAYASLPAFLIGVMESWSNPAQRPGALVQLALVVVYWTLVMMKARNQQRPE